MAEDEAPTTAGRKAGSTDPALDPTTREIIADEMAFVRGWFANPLKTGAVSPSGRRLARAMAAEVDPAGDGPVVELGPGTGVFTKALIAHGVAPERIFAIEFNADFCGLLESRFPAVHIIQGDAYRIDDYVRELGLGAPAAVISGLPLLTQPLPRRTGLLDRALTLGAAGMPFVQFSYAAGPPVPPGLGDYSVRRARRIWLNLPPAAVWVYSRGVGGA